MKVYFPEKFQFFPKIEKNFHPNARCKNFFVSKTSIKTDFGTVSEKFGIAQNCWNKSWEFLGFEWESPRFGSSNTARNLQERISYKLCTVIDFTTVETDYRVTGYRVAPWEKPGNRVGFLWDKLVSYMKFVDWL